MKKPRILLYDIENSPNTIYAWGVREQNAVGVQKHWELLSFAYQWLGEGPVVCHSREGQRTDERLVRKLHKVLSRADVVIAHNGLQFDNRKSNARFLKYDLAPPKPSKTVDTLRVAQAKFNLNSCSLDALAKYLGVGSKLKHPGFEMWEGCMHDDAASWRLMRKYNAHDITLLRRVYTRLIPWLPAAADIAAGDGCPKPGCGGTKFISHGYRINAQGAYRRLQCMNCGGWAFERKRTKKIIQVLRSA